VVPRARLRSRTSGSRLFHGASREKREGLKTLKRFRHLVAGRRGGKTLSAAWEVLFYALHPREFHRDAHGTSTATAAVDLGPREGLPDGLRRAHDAARGHGPGRPRQGPDFHYNKTERRIEFIESGTVVQFKTADDPQSLRGAGLDILWIDEAAFIDVADAWRRRPALSDKLGLVITTTTPHGKNWFWEEFFDGEALDDPDQFRVQYTSIDNPHFHEVGVGCAPSERYHPIMFKQEFLAAFDALAGHRAPGRLAEVLGRRQPRHAVRRDR
jgi:hypothetical protein